VTEVTQPTHDLVVLTADKDQADAISALLSTRTVDLRLPCLRFEVFRHPQHDPGVYGRAVEFLRKYLPTHRFALVVIDAAWEGAPPGDRIAERIATDLNRNGWADRSAVVVIRPETEAWCWVEGVPAVEAVVGLPWADLRRLGAEMECWKAGTAKPSRPKELWVAALRKARTPRSSRLFAELARHLPLEACVDPAFAALRTALAQWFGSSP
jgi:hypothetical protein